VGDQAVGAVLNAIFGIGEIAAAFIPKGIQGAIAKQAAECAVISATMAREVLTLPVLKIIIMGHRNPPVFGERIDCLGLLLYNTNRNPSSRKRRILWISSFSSLALLACL
jgi:hypothetical protein